MSYSVASRGSQYSQVSRASQGSRGSRGSRPADRATSFSPSDSYNPAVNESVRNVIADPFDEDDDEEGSALDDQRKEALEEEEENMEDVDPEEGLPFFQTQRGKLTIFVVLIVLIVTGAIVAIVLSLRDNDSTSRSNPTVPPGTPAPTPSKCGCLFILQVHLIIL
jgi:hypothetical protein